MNQEIRFSGTWMVAQHGSGKTFALTQMSAKDLQRDASLICLDSKGQLTGAIRQWALGDRLVVLDPSEPFAICPFDVPRTDVSAAADQIQYIFSALMGTSITPMQQSLLRPIIRALIIGHPAPTLETFREVIYHGMPQSVLANIPDDLRLFFEQEWNEYRRTRSEIKWRLQLLLENDVVRTMFSEPKTKFNISEAMDTGKCVVIDNSQAKLGKDGSAFLGRFFMARIWAAATQRHARSGPHKPVFVYVDEAHVLLDEMCAKIIDECRSAKIALILAHQRSTQIPDSNVRGALENCAIKLVNVDHGEIEYFSKLLDIPPERMKSLPQGHFAVNIRWEGNGIKKVEDEPLPFRTMRPEEQRDLQARMKRLYGVETQKAPEPQAEEIAFTVTLPAGIQEATVVKWNINEGDHVAKGDVILTVEANSTTFELTAPSARRITRFLVKAGDAFKVGTRLGLSVEDAPVAEKQKAAGHGQETHTPPPSRRATEATRVVKSSIPDDDDDPTKPATKW
jgi:biotin carboxyl carrier protein